MSLNTETLNTILAPYIRSLTDGETAENGVWEAINCFGTNWDIDAVDFRRDGNNLVNINTTEYYSESGFSVPISSLAGYLHWHGW